MMNSVIIHAYPRQIGVNITIISNKGDKFEFGHEDTAMSLHATGHSTVLEVLRYKSGSEECTGTIHFPDPASIELTGRKKQL